MVRHQQVLILFRILVGVLLPGAVVWAQSAAEVEYFETHVRPVLADKCYRCHGEDPAEIEGGLNLTYRDGLRSGGERGPAIAPPDVDASLLVKALRYDDELQMPPDGKLPADVIARFEKWVAMGAPDPRDNPSGNSAADDERTWQSVLEERKKWWSFQPIRDHKPPRVALAEFNHNPVDQFVAAKWKEQGLTAAPIADPRTLVRRLSYVLTGLPPSVKETRAFISAAKVDPQAAVDSSVNRLLDSPRFGERWARHWMDWIRYAETHGSEGDPLIPNAWRFRDYLIRALNADVPYDQLVREHLVGDALETPRINHELGLNESAIGTSQYRFVQHAYSPTDALDEQVRFTENQIDVISKAFLGVTVACARCHNHKFDPISQTDFYALYGIMASSRPAVITIDSAERQEMHKERLAALKPQIRKVVADAWLTAVDRVPEKLLEPDELWRKVIEQLEDEEEEHEEDEVDAAENYREGRAWRNERDPLYVWRELHQQAADRFTPKWTSLFHQWQSSKKRVASISESAGQATWDLTNNEFKQWHTHGNGITASPSAAGEFTVQLEEDDRIIANILPAGIYSHTLSDKHSGVLASPRFRARHSKVFVRIAGNQSIARYVVQNYPLIGETYPVTVVEEGNWRWHEWDAGYWDGDHLHIEVTTASDQPVHEEYQRERSWFGVSQAIVVEDGQPEPRDEIAYFISPLFDGVKPPRSSSALAKHYATTLRECIVAWRDETMSDSQALFLDYFVSEGLLPNDIELVPQAKALLAEYRRLEEEIPVPTRIPSVMECNSFDQPLFVRGDHHKPSEPVKRRFLEAIDREPYDSVDAGRRDLAESIVDSANPLTSRVIVNRIWHHTFGRGLVPTTDNFGQLGEQPSHPELLDYLATRFVRESWSIKKLLRLLTTSRTFQLASSPSSVATTLDPANQFLSHASLRRLEAEAIRDTMLLAAGRLDLEPFGEPVDGVENRRSVYVQVSRNNPDPLLAVFDAPIPISTRGNRLVTNVPAQALSMMNNDYVHDLARAFAGRVKRQSSDQGQRIVRMFELGLGRKPFAKEVERAKSFLAAASSPDFRRRNRGPIEREVEQWNENLREFLEAAEEEQLESEEIAERHEEIEHEIQELRQAAEQDEWYELALAVFSMKEFIYLP